MRNGKSNIFLLLVVILSMSGCVSSEKNSISKPHVKNISLEMTTPVIILGGGIAGLTAALYVSQANIPCIVIEGAKPGGALAQSHSVRNWPGKFDAPGREIVQDLKQQVLKNNVSILQEEVVGVDFEAWPYTITTKSLEDGKTIERIALSCIIAMGTEPNYLGIPGETGPDGYWGRGVSNCAVCEGSLYKDKKVAIVGGGDAAIVEAGYLANIAREVYVLVRKESFRAKDIKARDQVVHKPNVTVLFNTQAQEIKGDNEKVTHLITYQNKTGEKRSLEIDGFFLAIGSQPKTALFKGQLELDSRGFILLKEHQATSCPGVFAAGDVCDSTFVQAVTSAGQGCMAALQTKKFLDEVGFEISYEAQSLENDSLKAVSSEALSRSDREEETAGVGQGSVGKPKGLRDFVKKVSRSGLPTVIKFYSDLCIPCQRMDPIFKALAKDFKGRVTFIQIDVYNPGADLNDLIKLMEAKKITTVPTFSFVNKNGKEESRLIGLKTREDFEQEIGKLLKKK